MFVRKALNYLRYVGLFNVEIRLESQLYNKHVPERHNYQRLSLLLLFYPRFDWVRLVMSGSGNSI